MTNRLHITAFATALTALALATGCDTEGTDTVGPRGGTITSDDGRLTLDIPEGALDREVFITIGAVDEGPEDAMSVTYEVEPAGTAFKVPALLTYELDAGDESERSLELSSLALVVQRNDNWNYLADRDIDNDLQVISASTTYLSSFAIVQRR